MTTSDSDQRPSPTGPIDALDDRVPAMEALLQSLEGVESVSIIPGDNGGLDEIHVLSQADLEPKKVVRNVESALLAEAGVQIDHRIISVAQRRSEMPTGNSSGRAELTSPPRGADSEVGRLALQNIHLERTAGERITCTVTLDGDAVYEGSASGTDHRNTRLSVVGKAVLDALRDVTGDGRALVLDGVEEVDACGEEMVMALIHAMQGRQAVPLVGAALVEGSTEETAVLAVLDATNRWVSSQ